jgi:hypothetical protein
MAKSPQTMQRSMLLVTKSQMIWPAQTQIQSHSELAVITKMILTLKSRF